MSSTDLNFLAFLKTLAGMDQAEIIRTASRERKEAKDVTVKRGDKGKLTKVQNYITDLGDFLHFVRNDDNSGMSWPEAYLASTEYENKQRARTFEL